ncbi:MAG: hypothetical protein IJF47_04635 [Candidatus Methanomethylophilaceae archaeon]|nr:hypothetical protein [Candidatus Methanomethylophilaceae archaeon]
MSPQSWMKLASIVVVLLMAATPFSVLLSDGYDGNEEYAYAESVMQSGTVPEIDFVDLGDGNYTLVSDYLEDMFLTSGKISDVDAPLGPGALGVIPMEILTPEGSGFRSNEYGTSADMAITGPENIGRHSMTFSAKLDLTQPEFICTISHRVSSLDPSWMDLAVTVDSQYNHDIISINTTIQSITGKTPIDKSELPNVPTFMAANILPFTVADVNGDIDQEIIVIYDGMIYTLDYDRENRKLNCIDMCILGVSGDVYTPTDLTAVDFDRDGKTEVIITRSFINSGSSGEYTRIGVYEFGKITWYNLSVSDPKGTGLQLDVLMGSTADADVDNDGYTELVLGGYLWNNSERGADYNRNWANSGGELFLSFIEYEDLIKGNIALKGTTVLGDDNGTASTRYNSGNSEFTKHYELNDHNSQDTSIFLTDDGSSSLCRSPNWSNWTIPLEGGSLTGFRNNRTCDQVFFDIGFYDFNGTNFVPFYSVKKFDNLMDNNNVMCNQLEFGTILTQDSSGLSGKESLFMSYQVDLYKSIDDGEVEVAYLIYDYDGQTSVNVSYGSENHTARPYRQVIKWDGDSNPMPIIADTDYDSYYGERVAHLFTYTDPTVVAVMSAIPYDIDMATVLMLGSDNIGTSSYTSSTGTSVETSWNSSFQCGIEGEVSFLLNTIKVYGEAGYNRDDSWSDTHTVTMSTEYSSSHSSVAAYITPVDIYFYEIYKRNSSGNGFEKDVIAVPFYGDVVQTIFDEETFNTFVDKYNAMMGNFLGDEYVPLNKVSFSDNVEGNLSSYMKRPTNPIEEPQTVGYDGAGLYSTVARTVEITDSDSRAIANGAHLNVGIATKVFKVEAGLTASETVTKSTTTSDISGMAFSSLLAQGNENNYIGELSEAADVLSQYHMNGSMWAEIRTMQYGDETLEYVYVGYTVDSYSIAPKMGMIVPNTYIPDGTDENDPYNPTDDSIYFTLTIPGIQDNTLCGDRYTIEMKYQETWVYPTNITGLSVSVITEGESAESKYFAPALNDREVIVCVSGLSLLNGTSFEFRLNCEMEQPGKINPTLSVIGYKDLRIYDYNVDVCNTQIQMQRSIGSPHIVTVNQKHMDRHGEDSMIFLRVGLEDGERVTVKGLSSDGTMKTLGENLVVHNGYVVFEHDGDSMGMSVTGAVILTVIVVFMCGWLFYTRRE